VDHFRHGNDTLIQLLDRDLVLTHPLIIGELACGTPPSRAQTLTDLAILQPARQASAAEVLAFIDREHLFGLGCGIVDMHLLAYTLITQGARLWTLDKRLDIQVERFGVAHRMERTE
jgi:predicted nucleic acid-binding protein